MTEERGMRVIIDSNMMQNDGLREFLALSSANIAVLTDYTAMESFKTNNVCAIVSSWEVLRHFPNQIICLEGTKKVGTIDPRAPGIANRMISKTETKGIPEFIGLLDRAQAGDQSITKQLLKRSEWAQSHMNGMLAKSGDMGLSIGEFESRFTEAELARMRRQEAWRPDTGAKLYDVIDELARYSFNLHPAKPPFPSTKHKINHFIFRHAVAYAVYMLHLVEWGATNRKPENVRNDSIDIILGTYATYFNGLMTRDTLADRIYFRARLILQGGNARMPIEYVDYYGADEASQK